MTHINVIKPATKNSKKKFRCTGFGVCAMAFTRQEHLARHQRRHTGEKPFQCHVCFKYFSRHDNMKQHRDSVHNTRVQTPKKKPIGVRAFIPHPLYQRVTLSNSSIARDSPQPLLQDGLTSFKVAKPINFASAPVAITGGLRDGPSSNEHIAIVANNNIHMHDRLSPLNHPSTPYNTPLQRSLSMTTPQAYNAQYATPQQVMVPPQVRLPPLLLNNTGATHIESIDQHNNNALRANFLHLVNKSQSHSASSFDNSATPTHMLLLFNNANSPYIRDIYTNYPTPMNSNILPVQQNALSNNVYQPQPSSNLVSTQSLLDPNQGSRLSVKYILT